MKAIILKLISGRLNYPVGKVIDLAQSDFNLLLKLGAVELVEEQSPKVKKTAKNKDGFQNE